MSKLRKLANFAEEVGPGYENAYGQVTPFHVLFKDHGNQIAELPKDHAIDYVIKTINELNDQHSNDPEYAKISEHEVKELRDELSLGDYNSGMDILFTIKDKLLESEGIGEETQNEDAPPQAPEESSTEDVQDQQSQEQTPEPTSEQQNTQASLIKRLIKNQ